MKKIKQKKFALYLIKTTLFSFVLSLLISVSYFGGLFLGIENFFEDILFNNKPISEKIVVLSIDNESIEKIGQWPWPRNVFGKLFSELEKANPDVVGLDIILSEPSRLGESDDIALANSLEKITFPVVLAIEATNLDLADKSNPISDNFLFPIPILLKNNNVSIAHVNLIADKDGVVRNLPLIIKDEKGSFYNSLSTEMVLLSGETTKDELIKSKKIERIVFSGGSGSVRTIPIWRVISGGLDPSVLKGKIVFVGATASNLHDNKQTPMDKGTEMSGIEIQAQVANMFLNKYNLRDLNTIFLFFWFFIALLIPFLVFYLFPGILLSVLFNFIIGFIHILLVVFLFDYGVIANLVHINLSWISGTVFAFLYRYLSLDKEKREIKYTFSKYLSKDVLEELLKNPSLVKLGGEERDVTVFFSDVRSFTTLSEGMTPQQLTNFLNRYLTKMTNIVLGGGGVVDKYIGDAIMAFWGAPVQNDNQAVDAVLASLEMLNTLEELNKDNIKNGDPKIDIGIGINFGRATVGNMGSETRFDYTIMGDTVNLASRLESQTKNYGVKIIISEAVKEKIGEDKIEKFGILLREIDRIIVKGKNKPVTIFEVVPGYKKDDVGKMGDSFKKMRDFYYDGNWNSALTLASLIEKDIKDGPTKVIKERCLSFLENPPENWSGVYEMKGK